MKKLLRFLVLSVLLWAPLASCGSNPPKILFAVKDADPALAATPKAQIQRGKEAVSVEAGTELEDGDVVEIPPSYAGVGLTWFKGIVTVHGPTEVPTTIRIGEETLEQSSGMVFHQAESGRVLAPGIAIDSLNASFLVASEETMTTIVVFDGRVEVSPTREVPWKPFVVDAREERRIWHDGRLSPNRPLTPDELNRWIGLENQLLTRAGSKSRMVPSVVTLPSSEAQAKVAAAAFQPEGRFTNEGEFDLGTVARQEPASGRHAQLRQNVIVYERSRDVVVPSVLGMSVAEAQKELVKFGIVGKHAGSSITGRQETDKVHTQDPPFGALAPKGGEVLLTTEAMSVVVPDVIGMTIEDAKRILEGSLLLMTVQSVEPQLGVKQERVGHQFTPAGELVAPYATVQIRQFVEGFLVPSVVNMSLEEAQRTLENAGLNVTVAANPNSDTVPAGVVLSQSVSAGSVFHRLEAIGLTVSSGPVSKP